MVQNLENYPEEYITGTVNFYGREYRVTPDVLIPRLETEGLVRRARQYFQHSNTPTLQHTTIVDIGSGSGIIGTSVADLADEVIFLDISESALGVAENNFREYYPDKKAQFIVSDLLSHLPRLQPSKTPTFQDSNILFLANLPYIKGDDWIHMSLDTRHEPELALFGGEVTGFEMYERLFDQLSIINYQLSIIIEFGFDQGEIAEQVIKRYGWKYIFFSDYAGIGRFCEIDIKNPLH